MKTLAALVVLLLSAAANAQVVYEPLVYQYGNQNSFYYGGDDPRMIAFAQSPRSASYGRIHGAALVTSRRVVTQTDAPRVFTDILPGYEASKFGFTIADAANEARAAARTYVHKGQLLRDAGVRSSDHVVRISPRRYVSRPAILSSAHPRPSNVLILHVLPRPEVPQLWAVAE